MTRPPARPVSTGATGIIDVSILLDELHMLESEVARLYEWFSTLFAEQAEAGAFFTKMSREEQKHADLVTFQRQLVLKDRSAFPPVDVDLSVVRTTIETVRAYRARPIPPSLAEAVAFAREVENNAVETHYRTALGESNPSLAKFIASLSSADEHHAAKLDAFARDHDLPG